VCLDDVKKKNESHKKGLRENGRDEDPIIHNNYRKVGFPRAEGQAAESSSK